MGCSPHGSHSIPQLGFSHGTSDNDPSNMKTHSFKVGDKVTQWGARADMTIYCVAQVRYYHVESMGELIGPKLCYLTLVGKDNPTDSPRGWPCVCFSLVWSGDKAARFDA